MTDFVTMQTKIAFELARDDLAAQIKAAINDAIKQWESERFFFNEKRFQILTVAGQEYYDMDDDTLLTSAGAAVETGESIIELDSITLTTGGNPYVLDERTQQWFDRFQGTIGSQSQPTDYGIYGNQIRLYPVPDAVYTMNLSAHARLGPNPLTADADTNDWMTEGEALIRNFAKLLIARDILISAVQSEAAGRAVFGSPEMGKEDGALPLLQRKNMAKLLTGNIRAWNL